MPCASASLSDISQYKTTAHLLQKQRVGRCNILSGGNARQRKEHYALSVLRSKREISKTEFENTFKALYTFSESQVQKLPKRRKHWLGESITSILNDCFNLIIDLNEDLYSKKCSDEEMIERIKEIIRNLYLLEKPLIVLWNVQNYEMKKMVSWSKLLKAEMDILLNKAGLDKEYTMIIIDKVKVKEVTFLQNMANLHKYTHGKVVNAPLKYDNSSGRLLIDAIDDALYCVFKANIKIPETKKEYLARKKLLGNAVNDLYRAQRFVLSYFNLIGYSERICDEWSGYIVTELKLLQKLIKSDRERFSDLL